MNKPVAIGYICYDNTITFMNKLLFYITAIAYSLYGVQQ